MKYLIALLVCIVGCTPDEVSPPPPELLELPEEMETSFQESVEAEIATVWFDSQLAAVEAQESKKPLLIVATRDNDWFHEIQSHLLTLSNRFVLLKSDPEVWGCKEDPTVGILLDGELKRVFKPLRGPEELCNQIEENYHAID